MTKAYKSVHPPTAHLLINLANHDGDLTGPVFGQVLALPHGTSSLWHLTPVTNLPCQPPQQLGSHPGSV